MRRSPKDTVESAKKISRRALLLGGGQAALVAGLGLRMWQMQVVDAAQYRMLSDQNRINIRLIPPSRGLIFDREGILIAGNEQNFSAVIVREDAGNVDAVLARLRELIPLSNEDMARTRRDIKRHSPFVPITVLDRLSWDEVSRIAVNGPALPGVTPELGLSRHYPLIEDMAHVVGYVGPVSETNLQNPNDHDPLLQIPDFQIGKIGVEAKLDRTLRGTAGTKRIEVNSVGRVMRELGSQDAQPGANIQLTLDARLQNYTLARLGDNSAAAVAIDVTNGDLLAVASAPSFDPNKFVRGISVADYRSLMNNDHRPLANKAVQGTYPPGSTFKIVTALSALNAGLLKTTDIIRCPGYIEVSGRRFYCWKRNGHGDVDLQRGLTESCDVYFYTVAQRAGIEAMSAMATEMGLGVRYKLPMSAVAKGLNPDKAWKLKYHHAPWLIGDTINAGIGQGYELFSPLQLAVMTARVASRTFVEPRLLKSINGVEVPVIPPRPLDIDAAAMQGVHNGLWGVVNGSRGTALGARIVDQAMIMAGKTGTSQVRNISAAERAAGVVANRDLPWKERDHALFVCFAPFNAPKVAVAIVVEHGGADHQAAPMARDILLYALNGGPAPLTAYPASQRKQIDADRQRLKLRDIQPEPTGLAQT
ncbi:MAG: penicillin-binding protein 2 [Paracoccaceae bacterium]|nr:penicillin-binding protein 2 [Paracoccaceae bacterium]